MDPVDRSCLLNRIAAYGVWRDSDSARILMSAFIEIDPARHDRCFPRRLNARGFDSRIRIDSSRAEFPPDPPELPAAALVFNMRATTLAVPADA
ncbi:hypothetical protein [Burkholderia gladioli]|uniref:hypothetical protein n=1 Tax=Burkholderia gladioli TaxID=28095 RepID=UPI00163E4EE3|nr:hypothetical protein [Burkholderia gladioli]